MERLCLLRVKRPVIKKQPDEKEPQETEPHDEKEPQETEPHVYSQRIQRVIERLGTLTRSDIILLKNPTVIQWLYGDTSFLPPALSKNKRQEASPPGRPFSFRIFPRFLALYSVVSDPPLSSSCNRYPPYSLKPHEPQES